MSILMRLSPNGLARIESQLVCHLDAWVDNRSDHAEGYSIGWDHIGHDVKAHMHITQERADEILREEDVPAFESIVNCWAPMPQNEFDELVAAAFLLSRA